MAKKPVDKVRASRDGHEYHETWVVRKALQLLNPNSELTAIALEGLSPNDQKTATAKEIEIADVVLYYGGNTFETSSKVTVLQFKYSVANKDEDFATTDSKKTLKKFAGTYTEHINRFGDEALSKLNFQMITNQQVDNNLNTALLNLRKGIVNTKKALSQEKQFKKAISLDDSEVRKFSSVFSVDSYFSTLSRSKSDLENVLISLSASRDSIASSRLGKLKELIRSKAGFEGEGNNLIERTEVLAALNIGDISDLLPCPEELSDWGATIEREQHAEVVKTIKNLKTPLVIHAVGGVGKTVFTKSLSDKFSEDHDVVFFDCFGGGAYRATSDARHKLERGLIHIVNTLSFRGLCDPILPNSPDEQALIRGFRQRLVQCLESNSKREVQRMVILFIDAVDNAEIAAKQQGDKSFANVLIEDLHDNPIENVRLVVSCRTERKPKVYVKCAEYELSTFSKAETSIFIKDRVSEVSDLTIDSSFSKSGGNARVLEYLIASDLNTKRSETKINLDDLLTEKIDLAIEVAKKRGSPEEDLVTFLSGLTILAPPVQIEDYALANNVDSKAIESIVSDLAPLIEKSKHGVMFKDEPTETLIFSKYGTRTSDLTRISENLLAAQGKSVFAARVLPSVLYQLNKGEKLYALSSDVRFPTSIESEMAKRKIKYSRLKAAAKYAVDNKDYNKLVEFAVELSSIAEVDQRGLSYLLDNPELIVVANDADAIRRIYEARTPWPGTRHARLALIHTLQDEIEDAHIHIAMLNEWIDHFSRLSAQERMVGNEEGPEAIDCSAISFFYLIQGKPKQAAEYFSKWQDWYSFELAIYFIRYINILKNKGRIDQKLIDDFNEELMSPGAIVASLAYLAPEKIVRAKLLHKLAWFAKNKKIEFVNSSNFRSDTRLYECTLGVVLQSFGGKTEKFAREIFANIVTAQPRLYLYKDHSYDKLVTLSALTSAIDAYMNNKEVQFYQILPNELQPFTKKMKSTNIGEYTKELGEIIFGYLKNPNDFSEIVQEDVKHNFSSNDKSEVEHFLKYKAETIYYLAKNFANFLKSDKDSLNSNYESLIAEWESSSKEGRRHGYNDDDHFFFMLGRDLVVFASSISRVDNNSYFEKLLSSKLYNRLDTSNRIELIRIFGRKIPSSDIAGREATGLIKDIEAEEDVDNRASYYASLSKAILNYSTDECVAYFKKGVVAVDAIGSGDYRYINELLLFAGTFKGPMLASKEIHSLVNICDLNMGEEPHKFYWGAYATALSKIAGLSGLAQLSRWHDRDRISLEYTLLPNLTELLRAGKIDLAEVISLNYLADPAELRVANTIDLVKVLLSAKNISSVESGELLHQFRLNNTGTVMSHTIQALADLVKQLPISEGPSYEDLSREASIFKDLIDTQNHHLNLHSDFMSTDYNKKKKIKDEKDREHIRKALIGFEPEKWNSFREAVSKFNSLNYGYDHKDLFLAAMRKQVKYQSRKLYIENLLELDDEFNVHWVLQELKACKEEWSSSSTSLDECFKKYGLQLLRSNIDDFLSGGYLHGQDLKDISFISGISESDLILEIIRLCTHHNSMISGAIWLSFASLLNPKAEAGVAEETFKKLILKEADRLIDLVPEDQWNQYLYSVHEPRKIFAGMIWMGLGSLNAIERWRAAHSIRSFAKFGRWDVVTELVSMFTQKDGGVFQAVNTKFPVLNAKLWLLISLARLAKDYPNEVIKFKNEILICSRSIHVLMRHFASEALLTCFQFNSTFLSENEYVELLSINKSKLPEIKVKKHSRRNSYQSRPEGTPASKYDFSFEYDFKKMDVDSLASVFGLDCWQVEDMVAEKAYEIDPGVDSMYDRDGRGGRLSHYSNRERATQAYGDYVGRHALHMAAGELVKSLPVTDDSWRDRPWDEWCSDLFLTRGDGLWLSDAMDLIPLEIRKLINIPKEKKLVLPTDPKVLLNLVSIKEEIEQELVVDGNWCSLDGVDINISSAFVPKEFSTKTLINLSKLDPWRLWIPGLQDEDEDFFSDREEVQYLIPWVVSPNISARLDVFDPYGSTAGSERLKIARDITDGYDLKQADRYGLYWNDKNGVHILKSEAWNGPPTKNSDEVWSGRRLTCQTDFLKKVLQDCNLNLILVIRLRKTEESYGSSSGKYFHSTGIVLIDEELSFVYQKGNEKEHES